MLIRLQWFVTLSCVINLNRGNTLHINLRLLECSKIITCMYLKVWNVQCWKSPAYWISVDFVALMQEWRFLRIVVFKRRFWLVVKSLLFEKSSIGPQIMKLQSFLINMVYWMTIRLLKHSKPATEKVAFFMSLTV